MQKYSDVVLDGSGKPVQGAVITVTTYPAGAVATIYAADGGPPVPTVATDANGRFSFYAANGHYSIIVSGTGITPVTYNDITLYDVSSDTDRATLSALAATDGAAKIGSNGRTVAAALAGAFNNATQFDAYGDSITYGVAGTSAQSNAYAYLVSAARGWTLNNHAVNGSMVGDQTDFVYAKTVANGSQSTLMLGTNDFRVYKNDAAKQDRYRTAHQALLAWLAIPDDRKILAQRANAARLVYSGTWMASPYWGGGLGMRSSVVGSAVSAFVYGTTVYAAVTISEGDNTTFTVSVDGVSYGTYADTFSSGDLATQNGRTYIPKLIRIDGLSEGLHEVKLTVATSAAGNLFFDWAAGNLGNVTKDGPNLWVGNIPKLNSTGYASLGGTSDSTVATYNAIIRNNVAELVSDGLNIALVDSSSRVDPAIHLAADGIHPNDSGHQAIAGVFMEALNQVAKPRWAGTLASTAKRAVITYPAFVDFTAIVPTDPETTIITNTVASARYINGEVPKNRNRRQFITLTAASTQNVRLMASNTTTQLALLTPGKGAFMWNDGTNEYASLLP